MSTIRDDVHRLVEVLPEEGLNELLGFLKVLLSMKRYLEMIRRLEELEDALALDEAISKAEGFRATAKDEDVWAYV